MKIRVIETGEIVEISIKDAETGVDWTEEIVGNNNGFGDNVADGYIKRTPDQDIYCDTIYQATADTAEWWKNFADDYTDVEEEIRKTADELDMSRADVNAVVAEAVDGDLDGYRARAEKALEALRDNVERYTICWGTGVDDDVIIGDLSAAKDAADKACAYTQQPIVINDKDGHEVARRPWWGTAPSDDDKEGDIIQFGDFGFYGPWQDASDF